MSGRRGTSVSDTINRAGRFMITAMEHIGLCANDPKLLVQWYVDILGFRIVRALEQNRTYFIRAPHGGMLEVYPARHHQEQVDNVHSGLRHIALSVTNLEKEVERLRSVGVAVPQDTMVVTPEMKLAFFRDPEGNLLHLVERKEQIP